MQVYALDRVIQSDEITSLTNIKSHELMTEGVLFNCSARIEEEDGK